MTLGLSLDDMLPYGRTEGDSSLDRDSEDGNSVEAKLNVPFVFYQREFKSVFINENGIVSFLTEVPSFYNVELPMDYPIIAPFYSDVDLRESGQIYWRSTQQERDRSRVDSMINQRFRSAQFASKELLIVTWDQVGGFNSPADKVNTFQLVLSTDGETSFTLFLYPEQGIQWNRGSGKNRNSQDARAQVGFMFLMQDGKHHLLPYSGMDQISNIASWSNTDLPGLWIFKVGRIEALENIQSPDVGLGVDKSSARGCEDGRSFCHSEATCADTSAGFCCQCNEGWYGNGENCLEKDQPQRVNGRVNGVINGVTILQQDLHCYVVTNDGRTYTAISRVSSDVGWDLQGLVPVGTAISWMFALERQDATNGFSLTGGQLNYTAEVNYPDTGHRAVISMNVKGMNVFDYLTADVELSGNIPVIPKGAKISVDDYPMQFSSTEPGVAQSRSEHRYTIEGTDKVVPFTVKQTARWNACVGEEEGRRLTMNLMSARNFIIYDEKEEIVRYALTSSVSKLSADEDPCSGEPCGQFATCMLQGDSYSCECMSGFRMTRSGCEDVDECMDSMQNQCGNNADCINTQGSFECRCKEGYVGDGRDCYKEINCEDLNCGTNSDCRINRFGQGECVCRDGFEMQDSICKVIPSKVHLRESADPSAIRLSMGDLSVTPDQSPIVSHTYDLANLGPFDVGHLVVNFSWPLQDKSGHWLLYLPQIPYIQYSSGAREICEIDPQLINPLDYNLQRRSKRQAENYFYEDDSEQSALGSVYDATDYDYSHLTQQLLSMTEDYQTQDQPSAGSEDQPPAVEDQMYDFAGEEYDDGRQLSDINAGGSSVEESEFPESERVTQTEILAPTYTGNTFSRINFICRVSLAVNERASVNIESILYPSTMHDHYSSVAKLTFHSTAEAIETDMVKVSGSSKVSAVTELTILDPVYSQGPGRGIICGEKECHKYAFCHMMFGEIDQPICQCPDGFVGDGESNCDPGVATTSPTTVIDCRTDNPCGSNAQCIYQADSSSYVCVCRPGFHGDGYICADENFSESSQTYPDKAGSVGGMEPECRFGACTCGSGYRYDGSGCVREVQGSPECRTTADCRPDQQCSFNSFSNMRTCTCEYGYMETSEGCMSDQRDLCSADRDCQPEQVCQFAGREGRRRCECRIGFLMENQRCVQNPDAGCDILKNCDSSAECVPNPDTGKYECRCINGFVGNGTVCERSSRIGCNVLNNCGKFASCLFDQQDRGYRCFCDTARGFDGDGYSCSPVQSCGENPAVCDPNSDCVNPYGAGHGCRCKFNFFGDGLSCEPSPKYEGNFLLVAQGIALIKVPFSGRGSRPVNIKSNQLSSGVDLDCSRGKIIWTDTKNKQINIADVDGKNAEVFISGGFKFPEGLAVDWVSRNLFVTDPGTDSIEVISLENKMRFRILEENLHSPRGVAVHPMLGKVYWTDWDSYGPKVEMANMDGTGRETLVDFMIGEPNSIAVDYFSQEVCWTDAGKKEWDIKPKIDCISASGSGRRTVVELSYGEYPYGIAITQNSILWTDWKKKYVHGVDKNSGTRQKPIPYMLANIGKPYDLVNVPEECPNIANSCQGQPCGMNRMCLPDGSGGHTCR